MITNREALDEYLDHLAVERGLSSATGEAYSKDLIPFIDWLENLNLSFAECSPEKLDDFLNEIAGKSDYRPTTVSRHFSSLRGFLRYMYREGFYPYSIEGILSPPKIGRYLPQCLTLEEVDTVFLRIAELSPTPERDTALLELLYSSGLRISEALSIRTQDIDFDNEWLTPIGKGNKQRLIPLGKKAKENLLIWLNDVRPTYKPQTDCLIINRRGKRLSRMGAWKIIHRFSSEFGKEISPHTFRHSFATHCLSGGMDLRVLQELLGHADLTTTQIYTHIDKEFIREEHRLHHPRELGRSKRENLPQEDETNF